MKPTIDLQGFIGVLVSVELPSYSIRRLLST